MKQLIRNRNARGRRWASSRRRVVDPSISAELAIILDARRSADLSSN